MQPIDALEEYTKRPESGTAQISSEALNALNRFIANHNNDVQQAATALVGSFRDRSEALLNLPQFAALGEMNYTDDVLIRKMVELLNTATFSAARQ